jgi:23S rRNA (pseudouridine1915-N3)-methyltransferase
MIKLIFVGKTKDKAVASLVEEYISRIGRFTKVQLIEVKDEPIKKNAEHTAREKEADRILEKTAGDHVIILDVNGKHVTSTEFAGLIRKHEVMRKISFVVGGPTGLHQKLVKRADLAISFGSFTIGNQIMRVVLAEQLFRAYTIMHNFPYHK